MYSADWETATEVVAAGVYGWSGSKRGEFAAALRANASPETWRHFRAFVGTYDIEPLLPQIRCPTGVYFMEGSMERTIDEARETAAAIPGATFSFFKTLDRNEPATGTSSAPPASAGPPLSVREREVLRLLAAGRTNAQIADELVISPSTVLHHVTSILTKTGAANRTEAAAYAIRHGLA
jgi:DNA-binding CsgD family transcriptional regulator